MANRCLTVFDGPLPSELPNLKGAIVWFVPEPDLNQQEIDQRVKKLRESGAVRVKVMTQMVRDQPVPQAVRMSSPSSVQTIREVVVQMVKVLPEDLQEGAGGMIESCLTSCGL